MSAHSLKSRIGGLPRRAAAPETLRAVRDEFDRGGVAP